VSAASLRWLSGRDGGRAETGSLVRWRDVKRGPWQYGYYRGVERRSLTFSLTPEGPIFRWATHLGLDGQVAVVEPTSHNSENT